MGLDGERAGLVDEPGAGGEREDAHRPAAAVAVPGAAVESGERAGVPPSEEALDDGRPVRGEPGEDLARRLAEELEIESRLAGEHRIFAEDRVRGPGIAQAPDERREALLRGRAGEEPLQTGHVQLEDEGPREERQQPVGEGLRGEIEGALGGEGKRAPGPARDRREVVPQPPPGALDPGADELQEPRGGPELGGERQRWEGRLVRRPVAGDPGHPGRRLRAEPVRRQRDQALERLLGQPHVRQAPAPPGSGLEGGQGPPFREPVAGEIIALQRRKLPGIRQGGAFGEGEGAIPVAGIRILHRSMFPTAFLKAPLSPGKSGPEGRERGVWGVRAYAVVGQQPAELAKVYSVQLMAVVMGGQQDRQLRNV